MMMTRGMLLVLLGLLLAASAAARDKRDTQTEQSRPLRESARAVERDTGGEVLRAERVAQDGRDVNRIKVITPEGRVRVYREDARGDKKAGRKGKDKDD